MIYKNGLKDYLIMFVLCTLFYTLLMIFQFGFTVWVLVSGLIFGISFITICAFFSIYVEKKSKNLREEILKVRNIICDGPANNIIGKNSIGGWLFLSEDALEFYPHKVNFGGKGTAILIDDIISVDTKINQLIIKTNKEKYQFVVNKSKMWKKSITEIL